MSFALNSITFGGLRNLAVILFHLVKHHFCNDHYFVFSDTDSLSSVMI
jgi:hypothetical protein